MVLGTCFFYNIYQDFVINSIISSFMYYVHDLNIIY